MSTSINNWSYFVTIYMVRGYVYIMQNIIALAHVLRKCIEQVKLNDQCQGVAEIKKDKGMF